MASKRKQTSAAKNGGAGDAAKRKRNKKFDPDYFTLPHPIAIAAVTWGISILFITTFRAEMLPMFFGPFRDFCLFVATKKTLCYGLSAFTVVAHSVEAAVAGKMCFDHGMSVSATIKWVVSTFLFGFTSVLLKLRPYLKQEKTA